MRGTAAGKMEHMMGVALQLNHRDVCSLTRKLSAGEITMASLRLLQIAMS